MKNTECNLQELLKAEQEMFNSLDRTLNKFNDSLPVINELVEATDQLKSNIASYLIIVNKFLEYVDQGKEEAATTEKDRLKNKLILLNGKGK